MDILSFELGKKLGGGGQPSPTPSSGYIEDGLICLYDGDTQETTANPVVTNTGKAYMWDRCNSSDGATIEGYITINGASSTQWSRGFNAGVGGTEYEFCLGFGNDGGSSNSDYCFNPMVFWGAEIDDVIYPDGLLYGDKHTFAIVSTPDPEETAANTVTYYVDGVQVGDTNTQSRESQLLLYGVVVEGGTSRPLNGTLHNGRFYNRALTAAELAANHANDVAKYGGND